MRRHAVIVAALVMSKSLVMTGVSCSCSHHACCSGDWPSWSPATDHARRDVIWDSLVEAQTKIDQLTRAAVKSCRTESSMAVVDYQRVALATRSSSTCCIREQVPPV